MKFAARPSDSNFTTPEPVDMWVAKNAAADHFVTIQKVAGEYQVAETRRTATGWSGAFHGTCSTFAAAEAAGLAILAAVGN
jgi:hypothetical protein